MDYLNGKTNRINKVELIGLCKFKDDNSLMIQVDDMTIKVFIDTIDVNKYTRIVGHVDSKRFSFSCIVADQIYQIKEREIN